MPVDIVLTYRDEKNAETQTIAHIGEELTLAEMKIAARAHAFTALQITTCSIPRAHLIIPVELADIDEEFADAPLPGSDVEEGMEFVFAASGNFTKQIRIPSPDESMFVSGTPEADLTNEHVDDLVSEFIDGVSIEEFPGTDLTPMLTSRDEDLIMLKSAKKSFQRPRV